LAGLGQTAPGRLVLLTFPLDAVPLNAGVNDRAHLLRNVITFLAPGLLGSDHISLDSPHYTLPSLIHVQVGDTDKRGAGTITVTASSTTESAGMPVTLLETSSFGVFAGSFPLISYTNPPTSGKLRGANGNQITVKYSNAPNAFITASATVDTNPPTISNVDAEPDYQQAIIYWDTSEFADALVQFGESALMERTAYNPDPANNHAVTLFGLVPNRTYYYRVTSRDVAGNTVVDDNNGNLHQFKTLKPLFPPWSDNMNSGATNWSVFSGDDTQTEWTLGVPNNGVETAAHSPPAAWGCNLQGLPIDFAETMLISPAIYLTNGNVAKLNFWHSYDFSLGSDLSIEAAELRIVYNNGSSLATIGAYSDFSDGWEQAEVDLTPYTGQVVYLSGIICCSISSRRPIRVGWWMMFQSRFPLSHREPSPSPTTFGKPATSSAARAFARAKASPPSSATRPRGNTFWNSPMCFTTTRRRPKPTRSTPAAS
jgi:hypothetical protein